MLHSALYDHETDISIHASLAGGDNIDFDGVKQEIRFQSTPPSREATMLIYIWIRFRNISIHASLAGGDNCLYSSVSPRLIFQSTPPSREATAEAEIWLRMPEAFQSTPPSREATWPSLLKSSAS